MNKNLKKVLIASASLLMATSIGTSVSLLSNYNNVHAANLSELQNNPKFFHNPYRSIPENVNHNFRRHGYLFNVYTIGEQYKKGLRGDMDPIIVGINGNTHVSNHQVIRALEGHRIHLSKHHYRNRKRIRRNIKKHYRKSNKHAKKSYRHKTITHYNNKYAGLTYLKLINASDSIPNDSIRDSGNSINFNGNEAKPFDIIDQPFDKPHFSVNKVIKRYWHALYYQLRKQRVTKDTPIELTFIYKPTSGHNKNKMYKVYTVRTNSPKLYNNHMKLIHSHKYNGYD